MTVTTQALPATGYLRLPNIIGDPNANPPIPGIIPVCKSSWYAGVKSGRYPKSFKISKRAVAWKVEDICQLVENMGVVA